ncbi:FMN-dependent NADH-azoreductase [Telmatobacter bradus]|uniref:FMN-dependent NADH-azoreductase n=1 Tax=Telmatobacter bradus TaxID=474953 RepID=UPI003B42F1D5
MNQILIIESSPRGIESASRKLTAVLIEHLHRTYPDANFIIRDLAKEPPPHLTLDTIKGISTKDADELEALRPALALSDQLTDELLASDMLIIASPMWNFGMPSQLKAWIDHVVRSGRTFQYAGAGVDGLAKGKRAILVLASGGVFTEDPWKPWDTVEPYLRQILGFIGITDVQTVRAQGTNIPALAPNAILSGEKAIAALTL